MPVVTENDDYAFIYLFAGVIVGFVLRFIIVHFPITITLIE